MLPWMLRVDLADKLLSRLEPAAFDPHSSRWLMLLVVLVPLNLRWAVHPTRPDFGSQDEHLIGVLVVHSDNHVYGRTFVQALLYQDTKPCQSRLFHILIAGSSIPSGSSAQSVPSKTSMKCCAMPPNDKQPSLFQHP